MSGLTELNIQRAPRYRPRYYKPAGAGSTFLWLLMRITTVLAVGVWVISFIKPPDARSVAFQRSNEVQIILDEMEGRAINYAITERDLAVLNGISYQAEHPDKATQDPKLVGPVILKHPERARMIPGNISEARVIAFNAYRYQQAVKEALSHAYSSDDARVLRELNETNAAEGRPGTLVLEAPTLPPQPNYPIGFLHKAFTGKDTN